MSPQRIIGDPQGGISWVNRGYKIPEDFKFFKKKTFGSPIVMGNTTFKEFPRPLPGRLHCVVSRTRNTSNNEDVKYFTNPNEALVKAKNTTKTRKVFVIGGATIYDSLLCFCDEILVTRIQIDLNDGSLFSQFEDIFHLHSSRNQTEEHELKYVFERWVRNESELEHKLCT